MKDINALITLLAAAAVLLASGCASSRHNTTYNTTYNTPPADYQGRQTPHSIP